MKKLFVWMYVAVMMGMAVGAKAQPYVQGVWTKDAPLYATQLTNVGVTNLNYVNTTTNIALFYHPLSAGSLVSYLPSSIQPFIPPESWACTIGGGYLASNGGAQFAVGCGVNLAASVRQMASNLLAKSSNTTLNDIGTLIAPAQDGTGLYFQRGEVSDGSRPFVGIPTWSAGVAFPF